MTEDDTPTEVEEIEVSAPVSEPDGGAPPPPPNVAPTAAAPPPPSGQTVPAPKPVATGVVLTSKPSTNTRSGAEMPLTIKVLLWGMGLVVAGSVAFLFYAIATS